MNLVRILLILSLAGLPAFQLHAAADPRPRIEHAPVSVAVRGQSIVLRAQVTGERQAIEKVTLFYAVSRDAAPFKAPMQNIGGASFTGTIPADLTAGLDTMLYYIEARDAADATAETPWYTIQLRSPSAAPVAPTPAVTAPAPAAVPPATPAATVSGTNDQAGGKSSWSKSALAAGGVLLVGGAIVALSQGGGGGGGGGGSSTNAGSTFSGTATVCFQPPDAASTCTPHPIAITIDQDGNVASDTLQEGTHLEGKLSGSNFLLVGSVQETNRTGEIQYLGTVVNDRIAGSIQGSATTPSGTGTYSGNFSAAK